MAKNTTPTNDTRPKEIVSVISNAANPPAQNAIKKSGRMAVPSTKLTASQRKAVASGHRPDYIAPGSDEHAALIGLRKAEPDDTITLEGWALIDIPMGASDTFLRNKLKQLYTDLKSGEGYIPPNAPDMWEPPKDVEVVFDGVVQ